MMSNVHEGGQNTLFYHCLLYFEISSDVDVSKQYGWCRFQHE